MTIAKDLLLFSSLSMPPVHQVGDPEFTRNPPGIHWKFTGNPPAIQILPDAKLTKSSIAKDQRYHALK
jgi:hypothetical protein